MNISAPFIARPVATTLITLGVALAGALAFQLLPIAPLPQVDFPTISVSASLPGASPDTMAATVSTPLERVLGSIAGVSEITSRSSLGSTSITLQFDLNRDINGAAQAIANAPADVVAAATSLAAASGQTQAFAQAASLAVTQYGGSASAIASAMSTVSDGAWCVCVGGGGEGGPQSDQCMPSARHARCACSSRPCLHLPAPHTPSRPPAAA